MKFKFGLFFALFCSSFSVFAGLSIYEAWEECDRYKIVVEEMFQRKAMWCQQLAPRGSNFTVYSGGSPIADCISGYQCSFDSTIKEPKIAEPSCPGNGTGSVNGATGKKFQVETDYVGAGETMKVSKYQPPAQRASTQNLENYPLNFL